MTSNPAEAEPEPALSWWKAALGLCVGVLTVVTFAAIHLFEAPAWVLGVGVGLLLVAAAVSVPVSFRGDRQKGRSRRRSAWRAATAPIRLWFG